MAEASRRVVGISDAPKNGSGGRLDGSVVLTEANAERIVQTLCRVRGKFLRTEVRDDFNIHGTKKF